MQVGSIDNMMGAGSSADHRQPIDVAIQGNGFLRVADGNPPERARRRAPRRSTTLQYTRAGNLTTNSLGFLTTADRPVRARLDAVRRRTAPNGTGSERAITYNSRRDRPTWRSARTARVTYTDTTRAVPTYGQTSPPGTLPGDVPQPGRPERDGGSLWSTGADLRVPPGTARRTPAASAQTISGALELSNVDMATEFTNMIEAERGYQANSSVISTADQMMQTLMQMA